MQESNNTVNTLEQTMKSLWGASSMPFSNVPTEPHLGDSFLAARHRLTQLVSIKSSGLITGPNGVGKSFLLDQFLQQLSEKQYQSLVLTHSSLSGSGLLRALGKAWGQAALFRREDTIAQIYQVFEQRKERWPILVLEEAQNLSATTLEEIRLLACYPRNTAMPFSLILVGDDNLMHRLLMGVNRPLINRLSFSIKMQRLDQEHAQMYINERLKQVAIFQNPFEHNAALMLIQAANGIPRVINNLAQMAFENAAYQNSQQIDTKHVQFAIDQMPWLVQINKAS
jgi:general secretion pathway protein A